MSCNLWIITRSCILTCSKRGMSPASSVTLDGFSNPVETVCELVPDASGTGGAQSECAQCVAGERLLEARTPSPELGLCPGGRSLVVPESCWV